LITLANPEVRPWLNGVEPTWTMLEFNGLNALRHEPSDRNHAIRLEPDLADAEISGSAVTANALMLFRRPDTVSLGLLGGALASAPYYSGGYDYNYGYAPLDARGKPWAELPLRPAGHYYCPAATMLFHPA